MWHPEQPLGKEVYEYVKAQPVFDAWKTIARYNNPENPFQSMSLEQVKEEYTEDLRQIGIDLELEKGEGGDKIITEVNRFPLLMNFLKDSVHDFVEEQPLPPEGITFLKTLLHQLIEEIKTLATNPSREARAILFDRTIEIKEVISAYKEIDLNNRYNLLDEIASIEEYLE